MAVPADAAVEQSEGECFTFAVPKTKSGRFGLKIVSKRELEMHAEYSFFVHENAV